MKTNKSKYNTASNELLEVKRKKDQVSFKEVLKKIVELKPEKRK